MEITDVNRVTSKENSRSYHSGGVWPGWMRVRMIPFWRHRILSKLSRTVRDSSVACLEEIAYNQGYINKKQLRELAKGMIATEYGRYLMDIADKK